MSDGPGSSHTDRTHRDARRLNPSHTDRTFKFHRVGKAQLFWRINNKTRACAASLCRVSVEVRAVIMAVVTDLPKDLPGMDRVFGGCLRLPSFPLLP